MTRLLEYAVVKDPKAESRERRWKVRTLGYRYHVMLSDLTEVALWHWHPSGKSSYKDPHFHVGVAQLEAGAVVRRAKHNPSGRIAFEQVLLQLLAEYGVKPARDDWETCLNATLDRFATWRTWH